MSGDHDERLLPEWLPRHVPANDDETTVVHGDYRLDNVILHPTEPRIIGVLDWELPRWDIRWRISRIAQ